MRPKKENNVGPVPIETHYAIFKGVEDGLKDHLGGLEHEYFLAGLRVAYDLLDSGSEPDVEPYSIEFGYLGPLDSVMECNEPEEIDEEKLQKVAQNAIIPLDLLDDLYENAKEALEEAARDKLRVGVYIVLNGSPTLGYSRNCPCANYTRRKYCYYDKRNNCIRCYCTTRGC
jgi:hypothetical protein